MCGGREHHHRRRGYPSREQWVERLRAHREQLQGELQNVEELLERLDDATTAPAEGA
jgi:ribosomal protein L19E